MGLLNKISAKATSFSNSGFGTNASIHGGRFFDKNGAANVEKKGINVLDSISWYHTMIDLPRWKFMSILLLFCIMV
jgi:inward rectifier potassium channel